MAKNWIAGAISKPGALHKEMGIKQGVKIPKAKLETAAAKPGKLGKRARLAETLEGMGGHKPQTKTPVKSDRGDFKIKG